MVKEEVSEGMVAPLAVCHDNGDAMPAASLLLSRSPSHLSSAPVLLANARYVFRRVDVAFISLSAQKITPASF